MFTLARWVCLGLLLVLTAVPVLSAEPTAPLRVATFQCDVTPPIGHWLYAHPLKTIEYPLLAKGVVLEQAERRYVLCAIDWCVLSCGAHTFLRQMLADGADTQLPNTTIHCVHVHTAPILDSDAKRLLETVEDPPAYYEPAFLERVADSLAEAVKAATSRFQSCDRIGVSQAKVDRVASNRRIMVDGKIRWRGSSGGRNAKLAELPEGIIDPFVKTITFANGSKPIVRLHYYATHPQSFYRDARASYDFVGMAREKLQKSDGAFQIYFTGCGGDVAAGKYNNGTPEARQRLYERLLAGMQASVAASKYQSVAPLVWRTADIFLPPKNVPDYNPEAFRKTLDDRKQTASRRIWAARRVAFYDRKDPDCHQLVADRQRPYRSSPWRAGTRVSAFRAAPAGRCLRGRGWLRRRMYQLYLYRQHVC